MLLLAAPLALHAQETGKFIITGKIKGFKDDRLIYLGYTKGGKRIVDSCQVKDNTYHFTGSITEVGTGILADTPLRTSIYPRNGCEIFMIAESFTITHIDSFSNAVVSGSKANENFFAQRKAFQPFMTAVRPLYKQYDSAKTAGNNDLADAIDKRIDSLYNNTKEQVYGTYVRQQPHSPLALTALERYAGGEIDPVKITPMFEALSEKAKNSMEGKAFKARIEAVNKTAIGKQAIDFTQNDTAGLPIKLSSFRADMCSSTSGPAGVCHADRRIPM